MNKTQQALTDHITSILFNLTNPEGKRFRHHVLDQQYRRKITKHQCYLQMQKEAEQWKPTRTNGDTQTGRLYGLHTEVTIKEGKVTRVYIEID